MAVQYSNNRQFSQSGSGSSVTSSDGTTSPNLGIQSSKNHGGIFNKGSKVTFNDGSQVDISKKDLANVIMQERTNQLNYNIAQAANDLNYKMFLEQNAYNSASAQKERFLEAGINPTSAMAGQGATNSASWNGASVPQMQSASAEGFDPANGVRNFGSMVANIGGMVSSANGIINSAKDAVNLGSQAARNVADIENTKANTKSTKVKTALDEIQTDILDQSKSAMVQKNQADANTAQEQAKLTAAQAAYQELQNAAFPERNKVEIAEISNRCNLLREQGVSEQTRRKLFESQINSTDMDAALKKKALEWYDSNQVANLGLIGAQTSAANASATASYASAEQSRSNAALLDAKTETENATRNPTVSNINADTNQKNVHAEVESNGYVGRTVGTIRKNLRDRFNSLKQQFSHNKKFDKKGIYVLSPKEQEWVRKHRPNGQFK